MRVKVYFKTIGCRVNQVETQSLLEKFSALGHSAVLDPAAADLVVVNSCTVTESADRDAVKFLKKIARINPTARIAVTGCLATLDPEKILSAAPAAVIFANKEKEKLPFDICGAPFRPDEFAVSRSAGRTRAFVKVQDGCDLKCSYCLVPKARSAISSKPVPAVLCEIGRLAASGFREIVLCGTRLGMYRCPQTGLDLRGLMERLFALSGQFRLRFSSLEPMELSAELLRTLASGGNKFCPYFHLPLQSGSDNILRLMRRPYDTAGYLRKLNLVRSVLPRAGLYCDVIAGYPGETLKDFEDTRSFLERCGFWGLHVFSYSSRPGTEAAALEPLGADIVAARSAELHAADAVFRAAAANAAIGSELEVLMIKNKQSLSLGLAGNFLSVSVPGRLQPGRIYKIKIAGAEKGRCLAERPPADISESIWP